jgi:cell division protein FtsB
LRQGLQAVEERARSELGMVKENEEFYQVVPGNKEEGENQQ